MLTPTFPRRLHSIPALNPRNRLQVMESQGRLPLQSGGGGGPWAFGADDENGSLLQVT